MDLQKIFRAFLFFVAAGFLASCTEDCDLDHATDQLQGLPTLRAGSFPEEELTLHPGERYDYAPQVSSPTDVYYQWYLNGEDMSTDPTFSYQAERPTRSKLVLELTNELGKVKLENKIIVPGADFSKGCLVINEGWFGHESGSISYYNYADNSIEHWAYKGQNYGATLGTTTQSATLWNGKLYVCSKEQNHLVVMDPKTLYVEKSVGALLPKGRQAYEFIGINDRYGVVTANGDFYRVDLKTFEAIGISTGNSWGGCGNGMVYQDKLLLNVKGQKVYVIDIETLCGDLSIYDWSNKFPYTTLDITTTGGTRFVKGDDGNLYTAETTQAGANNLVKIKPDFSLEKAAMRADYSPSSFGSYREASFCGTPAGLFYYIAKGSIYKATFADAAPAKAFTEYRKEGYGFYGAGIRINPATNELLAAYLTEEYQKNLLVRFNATTGEKLSEIAYDGYYFPSTFIFN